MDLTLAVKQVLTHEGAHQTIVDIMYAQWQKPGNTEWSYDDMITWTQDNYGDLAAFAILVGKHSQQVCNGGHIQYYDNGYSGGKSGNFFGDGNPEIPLHKRLVELARQFGFEEHPVFAILSKFEIDQLPEDEYEDVDCDECGGSGTELVDCEACDGDGCGDCDNGEVSQTCNTCDGDRTYEECVGNRGDVCNDSELETLDEEFYKHCDAWETTLEDFFRQQLGITADQIPVKP